MAAVVPGVGSGERAARGGQGDRMVIATTAARALQRHEADDLSGPRWRKGWGRGKR